MMLLLLLLLLPMDRIAACQLLAVGGARMLYDGRRNVILRLRLVAVAEQLGRLQVTVLNRLNFLQ